MDVHHPYMDRSIPDLSSFREDKESYKAHPIAPVNDQCVCINGLFPCESYYWHYKPRPQGATKKVFLREDLVKRLCGIQQVLAPLGLSLFIQEGYRPLSVQKFVQEFSVLKVLRRENPGLSEEELKKKLKMFAASANGNLNLSPPPHLTGGAVDLTLVCSRTKKPVNMGKGEGLFATAFPDAFEKREGFEEVNRFRRLLYWVAHEQGVVTNPTEWWHLSYGDQMWAWVNKIPHALYGVAEHFE